MDTLKTDDAQTFDKKIPLNKEMSIETFKLDMPKKDLNQPICKLKDINKILGEYNGKWKGTGGCSPSKFNSEGNISVELVAVNKFSFKMLGYIHVKDNRNKDVKVMFHGTMECQNMKGLLNTFIMKGISNPLSGSIEATFDQNTYTFGNGKWSAASSTSSCYIQSTWYASK